MVPARFLCLLLIGRITQITGTNILAITTLASPSHYIFHDAYLLELAQRGYNVTVLGHDEDKHHHPNYTHITMEGVYQALSSAEIQLEAGFTSWETLKGVPWDWIETISLLDMKTEGLKTLRAYPDGFKFDLIIWDMNNAPFSYPLIEKFGNPPVIGVNPFVNHPNIFRNVFQSYLPYYEYDYDDHMSYWQRIKSNFWSANVELTRKHRFIPRQKQLALEYFGKCRMTMEEFERSLQLLLVNHHPVLNYVEALPPNVVPIGGVQINPKKLPQDLQSIMDEAKGVVLFSLGSNIAASSLTREKTAAILEAFSKLEQTVIWKFDHLDDLPKNVHVRKWVPQSEVLAHPNTVLFITHGGLLSSHETFYHGVPVVGIPFFLDQVQNVGIFVAKGIGVKLAFGDIKGDKFYEAVAGVLNEPRYRDNAKKLSRLYRDRQNQPLETAIYWIEYVLRHGTASHLDLATRDLTFVQFYNLDLILTILIAILLAPLAITVIVCNCCKFKKTGKLEATNKLKVT